MTPDSDTRKPLGIPRKKSDDGTAMTERTYTLHEITGALGDALKRVNRHDLLTFERPFNLFLDDVVRILKEPPAPPVDHTVDAAQWNRLLDYSSPND